MLGNIKIVYVNTGGEVLREDTGPQIEMQPGNILRISVPAFAGANAYIEMDLKPQTQSVPYRQIKELAEIIVNAFHGPRYNELLQLIEDAKGVTEFSKL